jgi:predicted AlkP superfamily pyrophosphatase or phosphodiesterase
MGRFAMARDKGDEFRVSPRLDAATLDLAMKLVTQMKLGKGAAPDMLSVSLSATDYIGHGFGTEGEEMCIQMANLDASLGTFFARLDRTGIDYAVVLTADHGGLDLPERLDDQALPDAGRADVALTGAALGKAITAKLGLGTVIPSLPLGPAPLPAAQPAAPLILADAPAGDYYVSPLLPPETRARVTAELVSMLKASPQMEAVFTREEILKVKIPTGHPQDWSLIERVRASFDPERSGDVYSVLRRAVVPIPVAGPGYVATHGSPWDYDRRVPLLFWRRGMTGFEQPAPVETVDIAPTLAALVHLRVADGSFDGRCLDLDAGTGTTCP